MFFYRLTGKKLKKFILPTVSLQCTFLAGVTTVLYFCVVIKSKNETGSHSNS